MKRTRVVAQPVVGLAVKARRIQDALRNIGPSRDLPRIVALTYIPGTHPVNIIAVKPHKLFSEASWRDGSRRNVVLMMPNLMFLKQR
ncbi:hypothetical protein [Paenibacillus sp. NEAU-GSW1]|uniref:hypothetical protein n=1 Tax=Paenibacillus sp. NEAU-GSW1 TaxID=2682486 RepID=UPI0012E0D168|nr:hypothetical protein [Paenibacillus sp. NEAU-GSW1]MUT65997.1 hypothetical protein [Paenibacillus sp. NEAU-GSW1]